MSDMGLIGMIVVAVIAILLVVILLRRKSTGVVPVEPTVPSPLLQEIAPTLLPDPVALPVEPLPMPVAIEPAPLAEGDDLRRLKGVGPKIVALLHGEGISRYAQIAAWTDADVAAIDAKLGSFAGRPVRDNWVDQARLLAAGDVAGYEAKYGKL